MYFFFFVWIFVLRFTNRDPNTKTLSSCLIVENFSCILYCNLQNWKFTSFNFKLSKLKEENRRNYEKLDEFEDKITLDKLDEFEDKRTNPDTLAINFGNNSNQIVKKSIDFLFNNLKRTIPFIHLLNIFINELKQRSKNFICSSIVYLMRI